MTTEHREIRRMQYSGFARFQLDRDLVHIRPSNWARMHVSIANDLPQQLYIKTNPSVDMHFIQFSRRDDSDPSQSEHAYHNIMPKDEPVESCEPLSVEDAEKRTEAIIESFAKNNAMRELLESARYFAGAASLCGALGTRRARNEIKRFES